MSAVITEHAVSLHFLLLPVSIMALTHTPAALPTLQKRYNDAKALYERQKFDKSNKILLQVYADTLACGDKKFIAEVLSQMGINNLSLGNYDNSLQQLLEAERIFKENRLMHHLPEAVVNLAVIYRKLDLFGHALLKHLEALAYTFQTNDEYLITTSLLNCAAVLFETGFTDKAFRAVDTAILFCDKNKGEPKYEHIRMVALNNKATFYANLKQLDKMLPLLKEAKTVARKYSFTDMTDMIDSNIVTCLTGLKRYKEASTLVKALLTKRKHLQDDQQVADLMKLGILQRDYFNKPDLFLELAAKALKLAEKRRLISRQLLINNLLKEYYTKAVDTGMRKQLEQRIKHLEEQQQQNKQTSGMEKLFDTNVMAVENRLLQQKQQPEFFARYDYLIGAFSYTHRGLTRHIPLRDIAFCEVQGNYLHIHTFTKNTEGKLILEQAHRLRKTMKDFESETSTSEMFFGRIHNSFIINLYWLPKGIAVSGNSLTLGGTELPISDTFRSSFKKKLNAFLKKEMAFS